MKTIQILSILALFSTATAFLPKLGKTPAAKSINKELEDEAVAFYGKKFPFDREPLKENKMLSFGMPAGYARNMESKPRKRTTDISEKDARASFNELAKIYGAKNALDITKVQPLLLSFPRANFAATQKAYGEIFGEEEALAMVCRNPSLLGVRPAVAANAKDEAMYLSYLVAATRPLGPVLMLTLLGLIMVPAIEGATGIPISIRNFL